MKKEDIKILLFDLCSRLPNNVILKTPDGDGYLCDICNAPLLGWQVSVRIGFEKINFSIEEVTPYLRTMSSMTEEEYQEFGYDVLRYTPREFDWLNVHYFDYRGLIKKGLALEASKGMYEIK